MSSEMKALEEGIVAAVPHGVRAFFEGKWWIAIWLIAAAEWLELFV